ncbi:MAG TPA: hypothetical protein VLA72_20455 [Anaerolineales bacterium]|nr:hypothetical protein [Anaerolineales bacterium]
MTANLLVIKERKRPDPFLPAAQSDFEFEVGESIDPQIVVTNPRITLYCLDHAHQRALFVENAPGVDLSQAPFFYHAQYENAVNLYGVSYDTLHELAKGIALDSQRLIFVYSTGRSGSTLVGAALNAVDGVVGLSEPDVFTQLVTERDFGGSNQDEISALINSCMKLQCKPTEKIPNPVAWAVKFRSFSTELGDLLYEHYPDSKNIFLYRDAESWMQSAGRAFSENGDSVEFRTMLQGWFSTLVPSLARHASENGPLLPIAVIGTHAWLAVMDKYLDLHKSGVPFKAFRFDDIKATREVAVKEIIEYCGLSDVDMDAVYKALERDSQADSPIAQEILAGRDFELSDQHRADIAKTLAAHPVIQDGHFVVPSTWER